MQLNQVIVQQYATQNNISYKEARNRLRENYVREVETVDFKQIALRAVDGIRNIAPRVNGLEERYRDNNTEINNLKKQVHSQHEVITNLIELIKENRPLHIKVRDYFKCLLNKKS